MLSFAGKEREMYQGMSDAEKDVIIAADELNTAVKAVESEADDLELDLLQAQDVTDTAKAKTIHGNLIAKYGDRDLTKPEFMYESGYGESKTKDFLSIYGSFDKGLVALRIVADANDKTLREDNREKLLSYLTAKYSGYEGVPVEYIGSELLMDDKEALKLSKKAMGKHQATKIMFVDFSVVVDIIMESI